MGSTPAWGTEILQAVQHGQKKRYSEKVWKDLGKNRANHDQQRKNSKEYVTMCGVIWFVKWESLMNSLIDFLKNFSMVLICGVYSLMICHSC